MSKVANTIEGVVKGAIKYGGIAAAIDLCTGWWIQHNQLITGAAAIWALQDGINAALDKNFSLVGKAFDITCKIGSDLLTTLWWIGGSTGWITSNISKRVPKALKEKFDKMKDYKKF